MIKINIDTSSIAEHIPKVSKNMLYSTVQGINDTAKQIQAAERLELAKEMILKTPNSKRYLENQIAKITFASVNKGRIYSEVFINNTAKNLLLSAFAEGNVKKEPIKGSVIAQPLSGSRARPTKSDPVQKSFTFSQMKLKQKGETFKGKADTFTIKGNGVFVRLNKDQIQKIYDYRTNQTIDKKLDWYDIAEREIAQNLIDNISKRFYRY